MTGFLAKFFNRQFWVITSSLLGYFPMLTNISFNSFNTVFIISLLIVSPQSVTLPSKHQEPYVFQFCSSPITFYSSLITHFKPVPVEDYDGDFGIVHSFLQSNRQDLYGGWPSFLDRNALQNNPITSLVQGVYSLFIHVSQSLQFCLPIILALGNAAVNCSSFGSPDFRCCTVFGSSLLKRC